MTHLKNAPPSTTSTNNKTRIIPHETPTVSYAPEGDDEAPTEEEKTKIQALKEIMRGEKTTLPSLRDKDRKKVGEVTEQVNCLLQHIETDTLLELNNLIYAGAKMVAQSFTTQDRNLGNNREGKPNWERRLQRQISQLQRDEVLLRNTPHTDRPRVRLYNKYKVTQKGIATVVEELHQKRLAKEARLKRYRLRTAQYTQNRTFQNNEKKFYQDLNGERRQDMKPDATEAKNYWNSIWGHPKRHNVTPQWLGNMRKELEDIDKGEPIVLNETTLKHTLRKVANWKAPGPDGIHGYWFKKFTTLHGRLTHLLQNCLNEGKAPEWMTKGRTTLIQKDPGKGNIASNYRPITCLPLMWKILTGQIAERIYMSMDRRGLLPEEQKGCRIGTKGANDLLYIDQMILKEVRKRRKNIAMGWIDYKKAYDMIPHSWILECLRMFKISEPVVKFIGNSMEDWKVDLTAAGDKLAEVGIKRGIFQGDSLSPLLFVLTMIPLNRILKNSKGYHFSKTKGKVNHLMYMDDIKLFAKNRGELETLFNEVREYSEDIGMEFGIEKCAIMVMHKGRLSMTEGIELPDNNKIRALTAQDRYKYLGVLECDTIKREEMKEKIKREYLRRIRKILETKLNSRNLIKGMNTWAVSVVRYTGPFLGWTKEELQSMDRRTRKLMTMHKALHPRDDTDRLYVKRKEGGRGLISIEDCVQRAKVVLDRYVQTNSEEIIKSARDSATNNKVENNGTVQQTRKERWEGKKLYGEFKRQIQDIADEKSWTWLRKGNLKRETESLIMAAQNKSIRTNYIKAKIDRTQTNSKCRMCGERDETVNHITSECSQLAQKEYKHRHDRVATMIHWELSKQMGFNHVEKWYQHKPEAVLENDNHKLLWDFDIQTDHLIQARRPDLVIVDKKRKACQIVDVAVPADHRVKKKEGEKREKYQDLARELKKMWNMKTRVVPVIVGALGTVPKTLRERLEEIGIRGRIETVQTTALLGTARILRKVLEI